jgi:pseudouridine-5'-phosphate glycosidase
MVLAQPVAEEVALSEKEFAAALQQAEMAAVAGSVHGPALTPFLLARIAEATGGRSLLANRALIVANARLAAEIAVALRQSSPLAA